MSEWRKDLLRSLVPANGPHYNLWAVPEYGDFMRDIFSDYWWRGRQLTTGAERIPDSCRCRTELIESGTQYGVARVRDPRCTIHWPAMPARQARCTCRYGLHPTIWYPTHRVDVPGVGMRSAAYTFQVDRRCVHHGDVARFYPFEDDAPAWETLDDAERRGE